METDFLPHHLRKYVVEQNYEKYTPVDQAVWRYILRQLKAYLSTHAHECYVEGLEKTGIDVERIPRIDDISEKLKKFGWRAMPVSGFIPPAAFMELQSLGVLPVASDMRTLDHLLYTPAPDIVHEAAGHAPILIHPEFSKYLQEYAQVAKKAIISKEDLNLYEAIRELSDVKENPGSTPEDINAAEQHLDRVTKSISHVSEATELSRMNWWTAEYGLIGTLENPKLFGAGLLSSVGEAKWCLNPQVKKIPLTVKCIETTYDITEPQPQLFVTPDFKTLSRVLEEMAAQMAYRVGGEIGLKKAIQAESVNTAELDSGLQISGQIVEALTDSHGRVAYIRLHGPSQLCKNDKQLAGHGKDYHAHGFGTPVGFFRKFPSTSPSGLSAEQWKELGVVPGQHVELEYTSGVKVTGTVIQRTEDSGTSLLVAFKDARVTFQDRVLFEPSWGTFDMALGSTVRSVFGGPADRVAFGETSDFVAKRVPLPKYSEKELLRHRHYGEVRRLREDRTSGEDLHKSLESVLSSHHETFPEDWLLSLEALELLKARAPQSSLISSLEARLTALAQKDKNTAAVIRDGLLLSGKLS